MMIFPALALLFLNAADAFQPSPLTALASVRSTGHCALSASDSDESSRRDFFHSVARVSAIATVGGLTTTLSVAADAATAPQQAALALPPMGLGAWAWGDSLFWGCKNNEVGDSFDHLQWFYFI